MGQLQGHRALFYHPNGIVAPLFESQGNGFLRSFYAGLLTTCGLSYIGTPCEDEGETLGLHGRLAATPAEEVGIAQNGPTTALNLSSMAKYGKRDCSAKI